MKDSYILVDQFKGSHYDYGLYQAQRMKETKFLNKMNVLIKNEKFNDFEIKEIESLIKEFSKGLWDELRGLADGLNLSLHETLHRFSGYYYTIQSGCSIVMNDFYMVRNYDQHPKAYDGRIILFKPSSNAYASIGPSMIATGRTDGMNEKGLSVGYNFVNIKNRKSGFSCNVIARILLETCADISEAIELLKKIPHRTAFNYCLVDASGEFCVVEVSAKDIVVRKDNISANHFIRQSEENHKLIQKSVNRYNLMDKLFSSSDDLLSVYKGMNDSNYGIYAHDYHLDDGTIHTAIYEPRNLLATFSFSSNRLPVSINFKEWLEDKPLKLKSIRGRSIKEISYLNEL